MNEGESAPRRRSLWRRAASLIVPTADEAASRVPDAEPSRPQEPIETTVSSAVPAQSPGDASRGSAPAYEPGPQVRRPARRSGRSRRAPPTRGEAAVLGLPESTSSEPPDRAPGAAGAAAPPASDEKQLAAPRGRQRVPSAAPETVPSPVSVNVNVPRGMGRKVNARLIERTVRRALARDGWELPASIDVTIVTDDEMREINATRRGVDEATDVLSFPLVEVRPRRGLSTDFFVLPPEATLHLGDVLISFSRVESQAAEAGHSLERELAFLTVHAVLHILGYDHETEPTRREMRRREEDVLAELGLRRNGS